MNNYTDANEVLNTWVSNFSSVIDNHIPVKIHRVKILQQPDWLNPEILDSMKERDKFKTKGELDNYKTARNKVNTLITTSKKSSYERKIEEGKSDPKSIWKIFREHGASSKNVNKSNVINNIKINNHDINDNTEIANEFNNFFVNIASNLKEPIPDSDFHKCKKLCKCKCPKPHVF